MCVPHGYFKRNIKALVALNIVWMPTKEGILYFPYKYFKANDILAVGSELQSFVARDLS